jgi:hypothetical protein
MSKRGISSILIINPGNIRIDLKNKRTKGNDGESIFYVLDRCNRDVLNVIANLYATLKWREYMTSDRTARHRNKISCEEFSGVVASVPAPEYVLAHNAGNEIPKRWFPFEKFYWGPKDPQREDYGTFYTFPDTKDKSTGIPFAGGMIMLKPKKDKLSFDDFGGVFPKDEPTRNPFKSYRSENDNRIDTCGCIGALVLPIPDCHLGFKTCKNKDHEKNGLDSFVNLSFKEKSEKMRGFLTFWNAVVHGRC